MAVLMGSGRHGEPDGSRQPEGSPAYRAWLESSPTAGEAFGDTGLASAEDCYKLRWLPGRNEEDLLGRLIQSAVTRQRTLLNSGSLEAEAARVSDLAAGGLKQAGLDPARFGIAASETPGNTPGAGSS
jgi:hypothetical protein